ncbi:hypothetical protein ACE7GA_16360 [Roseomonas sp. CCTCC AB2023176]|uniref:hypothetical protein n=1 Tax=Roseomonas sp. CCTCC AB2023176 TaxID=3342640 RepID=UPI0035E055E0
MGDTWATHPFPPGGHLHFSPLRRVQERQDSDGVTHRILVQTEEMSCGPAACAMLMDLWNGQQHADASAWEMRLKAIAGRFPGSMVEQDRIWRSQGPASGHEGSQVTNLERLLQSQRVRIRGIWHRWTERAGTNALALGYIRQHPCLLLWGWYDARGNRNGGHFTVGARVTSQHKVVVLDPWDGSLGEVTSTGNYMGNGQLDAVVYTG